VDKLILGLIIKTGCDAVQGAYWYGGLVVVSLFMLLVALWYKKDYKLLVLHLAVAGIIHPFEVFAINFNAYRYMPGIMPGIGDNILGAYASDLFIVPATAVVISAFSLSWRYRILFAAAFTFIDWYFTVIGIYEHYWWKSIYTGIGIIILYAISNWLWQGLQSTSPPLSFRLLVIYLSYASLHSSINFLANRGFQLYTMQLSSWHFADELTRASFLLNIHLSLTAILVALSIGFAMSFRYRLIGAVIILVIYWAIGHFGIFVPYANISSLHLVFIPFAVIPWLTLLYYTARLPYIFPYNRIN
jgi:hypothetical protein